MSENNYDFLDETGIIKLYRNNDMFLRPSMVSSCNYDILFGSLNVETPLRYDVNYRNYFVVTHGKAIIRLLVPKSKKYLYATNDYDNFEFISPVNPWNVQDEYRADFNKLRTIDVTLMSGQMIHIPAYWWYSIKFVKSNTTICVFKYKTYMNTLAISNHLAMRLLQGQNTKRVVASKMNIVENKKNSYGNADPDPAPDHNRDEGEGEHQNNNQGDYVSISMPVPVPVPTPAPTPAPYNIHQKATNTLNDDKNKTKDEINPDIVINL
jgi:hypothetical protein